MIKQDMESLEHWQLTISLNEKSSRNVDENQDKLTCDGIETCSCNGKFYYGSLHLYEPSLNIDGMEKVLTLFGQGDNILNGTDSDTLWEEAKELGFDSNLEYLIKDALNSVKVRRDYLSTNNCSAILKHFFDKWFKHEEIYKAWIVTWDEWQDTMVIDVSVVISE